MKQDISVGNVSLELTVTATANDEGELFAIQDAKSFEFEIKTETGADGTSTFTLEAEIPAVTATETTVEEPAANNVNIKTLAGTYAGTVHVIGSEETSHDSVTIDGNSYVWKKDCGESYLYWRGTVFLALTENQFIFTNNERSEPERDAEPTEWISEPNDIFII